MEGRSMGSSETAKHALGNVLSTSGAHQGLVALHDLNPATHHPLPPPLLPPTGAAHHAWAFSRALCVCSNFCLRISFWSGARE